MPAKCPSDFERKPVDQTKLSFENGIRISRIIYYRKHLPKSEW